MKKIISHMVTVFILFSLGLVYGQQQSGSEMRDKINAPGADNIDTTLVDDSHKSNHKFHSKKKAGRIKRKRIKKSK